MKDHRDAEERKGHPHIYETLPPPLAGKVKEQEGKSTGGAIESSDENLARKSLIDTDLRKK